MEDRMKEKRKTCWALASLTEISIMQSFYNPALESREPAFSIQDINVKIKEAI